MDTDILQRGSAIAPAEGRKRALVADDDPSARRFFERILRLEGFEVSVACNGFEAYELLMQARFDLVLSDISMPGMGGIQLLVSVRRIDADVPVILITGAPSVETAASAVQHGALRYLIKPVGALELRECVREATARDRNLAALNDTFESALDRVWMAYQPIVTVRGRAPCAYEALMRSRDPDLSDPGRLLEAAERLDRVVDLGRVVRRQVANVIPHAPDGVDIFINLHPIELNDELLVSPDSPLAPFADRIVLEVTERDRVDEGQALEQRIDALLARGFRLAIDDLGAGYSGLNSILSLRPHVAKIDMELVRHIDTDPTRRRITRSISELCADMGIAVVAEGVETAAERDCLVSLGIDLLQGFYFARPGRGFPRVDPSRFDADG